MSAPALSSSLLIPLRCLTLKEQLGKSGSFGTVYKAVLNGEIEVCAKVRNDCECACAHASFECFRSAWYDLSTLRRQAYEAHKTDLVLAPSQAFHILEHPTTYGITSGSPEYATTLDGVRAEAAMLASLHDDHILAFTGLCVDSSGHPKYIVTELAKDNLRGYLKGLERRLEVAECVRLCKHILGGLRFLHHGLASPVMHRDLKPENVLVFDSEGGAVAKIGDVGLSRFASGGTLTRGAGSPFYMAPEVSAPLCST